MSADRNAPRETRAAYPRLVPLATRWGDNDVYGHVNNVVYYAFFDTAVNGLLVEAGCRYFAPVAFPERITARVRVAHLGRPSVRSAIAIFPRGRTGGRRPRAFRPRPCRSGEPPSGAAAGAVAGGPG